MDHRSATTAKFLLFAVAVLAVSNATPRLRANTIDVSVYSGFENTGGGGPFTGLIGSFDSADIQFGTDNDWDWAPYGVALFGADVTGSLVAATTGVYRLSMVSDDGSELYIDGSLAIDDGGLHAPGLEFTDISLTAGAHPFEIQYFQGSCCQAGLDLDLPSQLIYGSTPEPATAYLALAALCLAAVFKRRKRLCNVQNSLLCTILHNVAQCKRGFNHTKPRKNENEANRGAFTP